MSHRVDVLPKIERMVGRLSKPLSPTDLAHGWSEQRRIAMLDLFDELRRRLESPEPLPEKFKELSISRGMDSWGITGGDLLDEATAISLGLADC